MKTLISLLIATIFSSSLFAAEVLNEHLKPLFISNPYNDKEIVLTGNFESANIYHINVMNFETNEVDEYELEIPGNPHLKVATLEGDSKRIAYITEDDGCYVFNYNTMTEVKFFELDKAYDEYQTKVKLSNDGSELYVFYKNELLLDIYDVSTGDKANNFLINTNPNFYDDGFINRDKSELALLRGDSLEFWSIEDKELDRTIPFSTEPQNLKFRDNGNKVAYNKGSYVFIRNTMDGQVLFNMEFDEGYDNFEFSANMKYMIFKSENDKFDQILYDTEADTLIHKTPLHIDNTTVLPKYYYITSDYEKALGTKWMGFYCARYAEMPRSENAYFMYEMESNKKLVSAPEGFIPHADNAVISNDSKRLAVFSVEAGNDTLVTSGLINSKGQFLKYIYVNMAPKSFVDDSEYLAFMENGTLMLYDIEDEEFERELETGMGDASKVYYSSGNGGRIIVLNDEMIKIYNYQNFENEFTIDLKKSGIEPEKLKFDLSGTISIYQDEELIQIDVFSGEQTEVNLINIPDNYVFRDITNNGRFILYSFDNSNAVVYDKDELKVISDKKLEGPEKHSTLLGAGFLGNHQLVWYSYEPNPIDSDPVLKTYDLVLDSSDGIYGEFGPTVSLDGRLYFSDRCPGYYTLNTIRDILVSVENEERTPQNLIYPNPASDYIELELDKVNKGSNLKIFDTFGKVVKNLIVQTVSNKIKINISELPPGVYFIEIGGTVQKFVKM